MLPKWAWSGSREQFLHCGLRKFRHSKSSVDSWYTQFDRRRFVYDTCDNGSWLDRVMVECTLSITHCLRLNLQLHTIDLVRTCRISSFCTVASQWQDFNWYDASRGPSAIAELLVLTCNQKSWWHFLANSLTETRSLQTWDLWKKTGAVEHGFTFPHGILGRCYFLNCFRF